jgi:hypothetical protein
MATESPGSALYETVALLQRVDLPGNWAALRQADGRFYLPAFAGVAPGYVTSRAWGPANPPTHTHGLQASFGTQSAEYAAQQVFAMPSESDDPGFLLLSATGYALLGRGYLTDQSTAASAIVGTIVSFRAKALSRAPAWQLSAPRMPTERAQDSITPASQPSMLGT